MEGTFGIPFFCSQTRLDSFKSPLPPSRKALMVSLPPQPPDVNANPSPMTTEGTFPSPITSLDHKRSPFRALNPWSTSPASLTTSACPSCSQIAGTPCEIRDKPRLDFQR